MENKSFIEKMKELFKKDDKELHHSNYGNYESIDEEKHKKFVKNE